LNLRAISVFLQPFSNGRIRGILPFERRYLLRQVESKNAKVKIQNPRDEYVTLFLLFTFEFLLEKSPQIT
jgi:hypothetical protein